MISFQNTNLKKILLGTFEIGKSTILNKGAQLIFLIYLSTFKSVEEFSIYIEFVLFTEILGIFLAHGANSSILKGNLAENINKNLLISTILVLVSTALLFMISEVLRLEIFKTFNITIYVIIASPIIAINSIFRSAAISEKDINKYSNSIRYSNLVLLIYPFFDFFIEDLPIEIAFIFIILGNIISILLLGYFKRNIISKFGSKDFIEYFWASSPFFVRNNMGTLTKNLGLLNISVSGSISNLSGYGLINRIFEQVGQTLSIVTLQIIPQLRDAMQEKNLKDISSYLSIILYLFFAVGLLGSIGIGILFSMINIINPNAWILDFIIESYILLYAVSIGFIKSNLASWEFLKQKYTGFLIIFIELLLLVSAFFLYYYLHESYGALGVAIAYAILSTLNFIINLCLFFYFRSFSLSRNKVTT